jgi:membrane fusion protein, heavy metal efflux system
MGWQMMTPDIPTELPTPAPTPVPSTSALPPESASIPRRPLWKRIGSEAFLIVVVVSMALVFAVVVLGMQVPGITESSKDKEEKTSQDKKEPEPAIKVSLVKDKVHTLDVPEETRETLLIRKGEKDLLVDVKAPTTMRPVILPGSTALDPVKIARIRVRFQPARVVEIGQFDVLPGTEPGKTQSYRRDLRTGDTVKKGQVLGVFYSDIIGSKKNDLLCNLVQLELDQKILDRAEDPLARAATPDVLMYTFQRAVWGDRNEVARAYNNLIAWDIPQKEIDELQEEAHRIAANKDEWYKTPAGRWVKGEKGTDIEVKENPWGRVTFKAPFEGVIVERNLHVDEMIIDGTVNLFQIADVSKLLVVANCPEDQLPALQNLQERGATNWTIQTAGKDAGGGLSANIDLPGHIEEVSYIIDPAQHTAVIKGYVENPGKRLRAGQYVTATVQIPPPPGVVEIPLTALLDDGKQCLVFVQKDPSKPQYTMKRVQVTHRFGQTAFVRSTPIPEKEQLTEMEAEEGLLPKEPLLEGERIVKTGVGELKLELLRLESKAQSEAKQKTTKEEKK